MMTPEEIIEALEEKFDGVNDTFANYLHHGSMGTDDCVLMGSCQIIYDQLPVIEKSIRIMAQENEHEVLMRSFATNVERLCAKFNKHLDRLRKMSVASMFDVSVVSEAIEILRHRIDVSDPETHKQLTMLAVHTPGLYRQLEEDDDIDSHKLSHDADFERFFDRIETDRKRLDFILHFRGMRKFAHNFDMDLFAVAIRNINRCLKKCGIKSFDWNDTDDRIESDIVHFNPNEVFYTGETVATEKQALERAKKEGHEYFTLSHVHIIHRNFVHAQFHAISPHELYKVLNLHVDCVTQLNIRENEKNRTYHLLGVLADSIREDLRTNWKKQMCRHLRVPYATFNSKYTEVANSDSKKHEDFKERIEEMLEDFRLLEDRA